MTNWDLVIENWDLRKRKCLDFVYRAGDLLVTIGIIFLNGILAIIYWAGNSVPTFLSLGAAALFLFVFDPIVQTEAAVTPTRYGRTPDLKAEMPRIMQGMTVATTLSWLMGAMLFPNPVPWIGAAMWIAGIIAILTMPDRRVGLMWNTKGLILAYGLVLVGFRLLGQQMAGASPQEWAGALGSTGEAQTIIAQNRSLIQTVGVYAVWYGVPFVYFSFLVQTFLANPLSVVSPFGSAADLVRSIRTRDSDSVTRLNRLTR